MPVTQHRHISLGLPKNDSKNISRKNKCIVKWGKEQPKITNLALTPQLLEMKVICQQTGATFQRTISKKCFSSQ